ncbi:MAG TPA: MmgE/PrpD family protein, partial [Solirubrobacterales bacterium]|nr:MmgE/PrpD family protein [Solirubrobacterales bacterium]
MSLDRTPTLSTALAEWIVELDARSAPEEVRAAARKSLINSVGTGVAAYRIPDVERLRAVVAGEEAGGPATVLVSGEKAPLALALMPNTALFNN